MKQETTCTFTGHRPSSYSFGYDEEATDCQRLKIAMLSQVTALVENGVTTFLTGMALGADYAQCREMQSANTKAH